MTDKTDLETLKRRALHCQTHHHACDCNEYAHAEEMERLRKGARFQSTAIEVLTEKLERVREWASNAALLETEARELTAILDGEPT